MKNLKTEECIYHWTDIRYSEGTLTPEMLTDEGIVMGCFVGLKSEGNKNTETQLAKGTI